MRFTTPVHISIEQAAGTLEGILPAIPRASSLAGDLETVREVVARGYFKPGEDERLRNLFARYLRCRAGLWELLDELRAFADEHPDLPRETYLKLFAIGFCAACALYRSADYLLQQFGRHKVIWRKLNEAEPRFGIPRKQFSAMYRGASRIGNYLAFRDARHFYADNRAEIQALRQDPVMAPVIESLETELGLVEFRHRTMLKRFLAYPLHALRRRRRSAVKRVMFGLFEVSGRAIAELRTPHTKRVTPALIRELLPQLRPGDVFITRHENAMSNLFLPGFWPHGALFIGDETARRELGLDPDERNRDPVRILEAKKDGVRFRAIEETLWVDYFAVIRPRLEPDELRVALARGLTHAGKLYDFEFDFSRADRLVCTELIYRSYDGIGGLQFPLTERSGRICLSAEDLLDQAVDGQGFEVVAVFGLDGSRLVIGEEAREHLIASYRS